MACVATSTLGAVLSSGIGICPGANCVAIMQHTTNRKRTASITMI